MEISFVIHEEIKNTTYKKKLVIENEDITLSKAFEEISLDYADVSSYYPLSEFFSFNSETLPYLISDRTILYNVPYSDVRLSDFLETHAISNNTIQVVTGMIQASGPDLLTDLSFWSLAVSIVGININNLAHILYEHFKKRSVKPQTIFDYIYSQKEVSLSLLASQLKIDKEYVKHLLKGLGYKYDRSSQLYIRGKKEKNIKRKLKRAEKKFLKS